ncbi:class I SAM-dependent methyltransferase [Actinomadura kijaniata]|uniref:Trans-aconitate methyltransferase n=1 Tax=Actinomadura namibiensis TaxID=182080 RepID=A0A7W3LJS9_ACTNM|nr:class I SAM-dependent methyltransferase [Actinomadura namibiensis]MBA8949426.1 trans-aconitate methyltransferase [Actinomadura namibiensis]
MTRLLDDDALERSPVVANNAMNRERTLRGYARGLGVDIVAARPARWLDLCCGTGRALFEAAALLPDTEIVGVDLVDHFLPAVPPANLRLVTASVAAWEPPGAFDLITCVHGLHYVGDKLGTLARVASWLAPDGLFVADFDARGVHVPSPRRLAAELRANGFVHDARRRRVSLRGRREVAFPYRYRGADDQVGPNYTGQPAVASFYVDENGSRPGGSAS